MMRGEQNVKFNNYMFRPSGGHRQVVHSEVDT